MFKQIEKNNIKYYKSDIFDKNIIHAFTTRVGGNTPFPMESFSLGIAENNNFEPFVNENKKNICKILNLDYKKIINPEQKHTDNIKIVTSINDDITNTDGIITNQPDLVLMLVFADCIPIILYSKEKQVIGVIHCGWKGTAKQIVKKAVKLFEEQFNAMPEEISALIGAGICQSCYQVSPDVAMDLNSTIIENNNSLFKEQKDGSVNIDLKLINKQQLIESGIKKIDILNKCTSCDNNLFYSYRKEKGKTGRHAAICCIKEE